MSDSFTVIENGRAHDFEAEVTGRRVRLSQEALASRLGWELKAEGLCRGDVCVPVADRAGLATDGSIDLESLAEALGQPIAIDVAEGVAALGTAAIARANQLEGLEAPDFTLPDLQGKLHSLSDHRGSKVLLVAYASW